METNLRKQKWKRRVSVGAPKAGGPRRLLGPPQGRGGGAAGTWLGVHGGWWGGLTGEQRPGPLTPFPVCPAELCPGKGRGSRDVSVTSLGLGTRTQTPVLKLWGMWGLQGAVQGVDSEKRFLEEASMDFGPAGH